jgi:hypothetical protein
MLILATGDICSNMMMELEINKKRQITYRVAGQPPRNGACHGWLRWNGDQADLLRWHLRLGGIGLEEISEAWEAGWPF